MFTTSSALGVATQVLAVGCLSLFAFNAQATVVANPFVQGQATASAGLPGNVSNSSSPTYYTAPNTATASANDGIGGVSTTVATFTETSATFQFTQNITDPDSTSGTAYAEFMATALGDFYSITDTPSACTSCTYDNYSADATLTNETTQQVLYDTVNGGISSGMLIIGDEYEFSASASLMTMADPTFTYAPSFTLSPAMTPAPENPAALIPAVLGGLALLRRRLRCGLKA